MKTPLVIAAALAIYGQPAAAKSVTWKRQINATTARGDAMYVGKCSNFLVTEVCPESKPISGVIKVGSTVNGMKIGAIRCEYHSKTMRGFRGGPKYISISGTYNCKAAPNRWAANQTDVRPWIYVIGVEQ